jgi:hypothetical protein
MIVFEAPHKPKLPEPATPEGDTEAEKKAAEEASRRARAAAAGRGRQASLLTGGAGAPQGQRRTLLGG